MFLWHFPSSCPDRTLSCTLPDGARTFLNACALRRPGALRRAIVAKLGTIVDMPGKHRYSAKEHRQIEHIAESEEARGHSPQEAKAIGYATVNKQNPDEHRFTAKEERQAEHIIDSEEKRGVSEDEARRIAYATVNKQRS